MVAADPAPANGANLVSKFPRALGERSERGVLDLTLAGQLGNDELRVDAYFELAESELGGRFEACDQPPVLRDVGRPNTQRPTGLAEERSIDRLKHVAEGGRSWIAARPSIAPEDRSSGAFTEWTGARCLREPPTLGIAARLSGTARRPPTRLRAHTSTLLSAIARPCETLVARGRSEP